MNRTLVKSYGWAQISVGVLLILFSSWVMVSIDDPDEPLVQYFILGVTIGLLVGAAGYMNLFVSKTYPKFRLLLNVFSGIVIGYILLILLNLLLTLLFPPTLS